MSGEMTLLLGLDVGTQGTKALLVDAEKCEVVARASASYGLIEGLPPGAAEQHPQTWIAAVRDATSRLFSERPADRARVARGGVSGQQHGLVLLDARGEVLRPAKLWCDTSTAAEADELSNRLGRRVPVGYTASKVAWTARREPEIWSRARSVMLPHDYVNCRLTSARTAEAGDASGTGWFDVRERRFDYAAAAQIDARLPEMLAPLVPGGDACGNLSTEGAALLGLRKDIPVAAGSGDNMCSALGSGATRAGVAVLSLGTSATVFGFSARAVVDPEGLIAPFCDATSGWLPLLCVMNATGVTEEGRRATGLDHDVLTARGRRGRSGRKRARPHGGGTDRARCERERHLPRDARALPRRGSRELRRLARGFAGPLSGFLLPRLDGTVVRFVVGAEVRPGIVGAELERERAQAGGFRLVAVLQLEGHLRVDLLV